jgi:pyrimidine deaminase RibD-like protein
VTLEPCAQRSTGGISCSERLIAAGVAKVVIACADASPFASGHGARRLQAASVAVETGMLEAEAAAALYADYRPGG